MIVTIIHPSVIDDDVQPDLHTRAEPQLVLSPRFFLHWDPAICCTARPAMASGYRPRILHGAAGCGHRRPPGLAVVYSSGYGSRRPDGIAVVPVGALGP